MALHFKDRSTMIRSIAAIATCLCFATASLAGTLPLPKGEVILTVTGNIQNTNGPSEATFDREMLVALGETEIKTKSPWYDAVSTFDGVPFKKVMDYVGASGTRIRAVALNDYETEIPMDDVQNTEVILAMKRDGEVMDVRDKGPIFVIYPYDSSPEFQTQTYYGRSAWQVTKLVVE